MNAQQLQHATDRNLHQIFHKDTKNEFEETRRKNKEGLKDMESRLKDHITAELKKYTPMKPNNHSGLTSGSCVPANFVVDDSSCSRESLFIKGIGIGSCHQA
jgi:hypothetical protein